MQKLARAVVGTNNIDNCSRYCQSPATAGLFRTVGYGGDSGSITDIEKADLVLIIGSNTAESHPVLATRVKSAHKLHGQKLIVADLRENEMARRADLFLHPKPGTDLVWLSRDQPLPPGQRAWRRQTFIDQWVNGLEEYRKSLEPFTLELRLAHLRPPGRNPEAKSRTPIAEAEEHVHSLGDGSDPAHQGSDTSTAISNLLLITGTTCGREPALIRCAATTMCRERATTGRCRTCCRATSQWMTRSASAFRSRLESDTAVDQRAG